MHTDTTVNTTAKHSTLTKTGRHGTLYRYAIEYIADPDSPTYTWHCWAYSLEHAVEQFHNDDEGFQPTRYSRLTDGPKHRQTWHKF